MPSLDIRPFTPGDVIALSAWTGTPAAALREDAEGREGWLAWDGAAVVGALFPWRSPDGRVRLFFERCRQDAWAPLLAQVPGPAVTTVRDATPQAVLEDLGFRPARTDRLYELPARPHDVPLPAGVEVLSAADVPPVEVMALDTRLRDEVPGTDGWTAAPDWFLEENHHSPYFDPECYLIARAGAENVGLIRVWNGPRPRPRLGLVGVLPGWRGQGLAAALLARVLTVWAVRGADRVTAEVDAGNAASRALMARFGGMVVGTETELVREA
ncbi:GNAT family N-acetyltransferase [Deinococcus ficus]|uniref:GNAT family N-acetyltransferase n=1 Tax=Deinococcus ficus TaxID=317577 RepID=A0A221SX65_9DEIO|nr:GNAT family N-acetyltransferase [Deinococcus ficus]ASN81249.1 GNAT family N-acetyltransferase [Deinococcus ficus]